MKAHSSLRFVENRSISTRNCNFTDLITDEWGKKNLKKNRLLKTNISLVFRNFSKAK